MVFYRKRIIIIALILIMVIQCAVSCTPGGGEETTDDTGTTDAIDVTTVSDETTAAQITDIDGYETWVVDWNHELFVDFDYDVRAYESYLEKQGDELTQDEKHKLFHLKMVLWVYHTKVLEGGYDKPIHCLYTRIGDYPGVVNAKLIYYYNPITEADDPDYEYVVKGIGISSPFLLFFYRLPKSEATTG